MKILALDQSTKITGYTILDNEKLIECDIIDLSNEGNVVERIAKLKIWLNNMIAKHEPDIIGLEEIYYQRNTKTYKILAELLGVLENNLYEKDLGYIILEPSKWRSILGIKGRKREQKQINAQLYIKNRFGINVSVDAAESACIACAIQKKYIKKK